MSDLPSYGTRIKFQKRDHLLVSYKIYSNGYKTVRLFIDTQEMVYKLADPVSGVVLETGGQGINNLEVLQRRAKKALQAFLEIDFDKEVRNVKSE